MWVFLYCCFFGWNGVRAHGRLQKEGKNDGRYFTTIAYSPVFACSFLPYQSTDSGQGPGRSLSVAVPSTVWSAGCVFVKSLRIVRVKCTQSCYAFTAFRLLSYMLIYFKQLCSKTGRAGIIIILKFLFIYLFIFGCVGSLLLRAGFL